MENKNHTELKEVKKYLALLSNSNDYSFKVTSKTDDGNLTLSFEDSSITLKDKNYKYLIQKLKHRHLETIHTLKKNQELLSKMRSSYLSIQKGVLRDLKRIDKNESSIKHISQYIDEIERQETFYSLHNLDSLPTTILKLERFKHFQCCQVIIHEKGNSFARSYSNTGHERKIPVNSFNKIFQTIKKGKGHYFSPQQFPIENIDLIGSILSFTSTNQRFNWVMLFGRNDLLIPTHEESRNCEDGFNQISSIVNSLLNKYQYDDKVSNIIKVLEFIEYPICIVDLHDRIIFANNNYENNKESKLNKMLSYRTYFKNYTMSLYYPSEKKENSTELYHHHKVTLLGELLNTLGHELSNPLFGLSLSADLLKSTNETNYSHELLNQVSSSAARCQQIISSFSQLYDNSDLDKEIDVIDVITETVTLTKSESRGIKKNIINHIPPHRASVVTNPTYLSQIIFNLIINSSQAILSSPSAKNGVISIECSFQDDFYTITVADNGPGIPEELLGQITNTYFTTKKTGNGLGLAICINLLERLGGSLEFANRKNTPGAIFSIILPIR